MEHLTVQANGAARLARDRQDGVRAPRYLGR
jgi:hypothetical protein